MKFFSKFKKVNVFLILFAFIGTIFLSSFSKLVLADENEYVLTNVLNGLIPTTNSKHMISGILLYHKYQYYIQTQQLMEIIHLVMMIV
ncbi:MAG: hypothetical protein ACLSBN_15460 [Clostridium perfringens]